jgi:3-hydroxybutyryl-CoA dehydrogenase
MRLPILPPLTNADMVGNDLVLAIHSYILKHLENSPDPSPLLQAKVRQNELGFKSGRGFHDWTPEKAKECREDLTRYLIRAVREAGRST